MSRLRLELGDAVRYGGRDWTLAGIEGTLTSSSRIWLAEKDVEGALAVFGP